MCYYGMLISGLEMVSDIIKDGRFFGMAGGLMLSVYNLIETKKLPIEQVPVFDRWYWIFFWFWPLVGALFVHAYIESGNEMKGIVAVQIGLSSPLILKGMLTPTVKNNGKPTLVEFPDKA